jgi:exosortase F-associated protein
MLQKILNHKIRIAIALLFVLLLVIIRAYEDALFYDPFLNFYKKDYHNLSLPETNSFKLFMGILYRYFLNSILSLAIIYVLFKDNEGVKFASFLFLIFFIILIIAFFSLLSLFDEPSKMVLFYVRRFLIQPIFLLLFLPAFYYQNRFK